MPTDSRYKSLFEDFSRLNIMIIGDVMVDSYLWGKVERISPEAPIPIVALRKRENRMGGAANVAMNIKAMGARPLLCSVIGSDEKGDRFLELLERERIRTEGIVQSKERVTTTKFRIFGNNIQMLRVDEEVEHELTPHDHQKLLENITNLVEREQVHCIIFQDYDKGVISPDLISEVVTLAKQKNIPVTVDPKKKNFPAYRGVTLFKPNLKELREGMNIAADVRNPESLKAAAEKVFEALNCHYVLITLSEAGVMISQRQQTDDGAIFIPSHVRSVADVSGAGDTVISLASLCLALGCTPHEIAFISNLAGGLVCEEVGVVPVHKEKLLREVLSLL